MKWPREMVRTVVVFVILLLIPVISRHEVNSEIIHIGISTPGLYEIPTEIAQRKGFYREEGLESRKVVVRTGLHVAALLAGELDYSTVSGTIGRAAIQEFPVKGVMGWFDRPLHILVTRPGNKRVTDLKARE